MLQTSWQLPHSPRRMRHQLSTQERFRIVHLTARRTMLSVLSAAFGTVTILTTAASAQAMPATAANVTAAYPSVHGSLAARSPAIARGLMPCQEGAGNKNVTATVANGSYSGNVTWGVHLVGKEREPYIDVNGKLHSSRGTTTLYLNYEFCGSPHQLKLASANAGQTVTVAKNPAVSNISVVGSFYNVTVEVCNNYNGYRCGHPV
jgi:hypothetical protein